MAKLLTKEEFFDIEECECGKPVFKFHNTSKNIHVMKCMSTSQEYDLKTKKWVLAKKQPCKMYNIYKGEPGVIYKLEKRETVKENKPPNLKEKLVSLFNFLPLSDYLSTLQEIDILVKNNLKREPRKTFFNNNVPELESYNDYRNRIFSEEIVDRDILIIKKPVKKPVKKQIVKKPVLKINDFVDVSESESDNSDTNSECSREYSDTDSDKQDSDYSEEHSEISEYEQDFDDDCSDDFGAESDY